MSYPGLFISTLYTPSIRASGTRLRLTLPWYASWKIFTTHEHGFNNEGNFLSGCGHSFYSFFCCLCGGGRRRRFRGKYLEPLPHLVLHLLAVQGSRRMLAVYPPITASLWVLPRRAKSFDWFTFDKVIRYLFSLFLCTLCHCKSLSVQVYFGGPCFFVPVEFMYKCFSGDNVNFHTGEQ